jgi:hypothetical protein
MPTATKNRRQSNSSSSRKSAGRSKRPAARSRSQSASRSKSNSRSAPSGGRKTQRKGMSSRTSSRSRGPSAGASNAPRSKRAAQQASSRSRSRSSAKSQTTTNLEEIREWVEQRGGTPATVRGTGRGSEHAGLLRIDFPGYSGKQTLEPLSWEEFNEKFEEANLAFLYDNNRGSKFNKFVARQKSKTSRR